MTSARPSLARERRERVERRDLLAEIEMRRGLVQHEQRRVLRDERRQREAPPLAAGKRSRVARVEARETERRKRGSRARRRRQPIPTASARDADGARRARSRARSRESSRRCPAAGSRGSARARAGRAARASCRRTRSRPPRARASRRALLTSVVLPAPFGPTIDPALARVQRRDRVRDAACGRRPTARARGTTRRGARASHERIPRQQRRAAPARRRAR